MNNETLDKKQLNKRFLDVAMGLIGREPGQVRNQKELAERIDEFPVIFSQIKGEKRSVSLHQMTKLVNEFNLNANYFLRRDNSQENLKHSVGVSFGDTNHNEGTVFQGHFNRSVQGTVHGNVYNIEKKIQEASPEIQHHIEQLANENEKIKGDLDSLKKMIGLLEIQLVSSNRQIELTNERLTKALEQNTIKDERLFTIQQELVDVYRDKKKK